MKNTSDKDLNIKENQRVLKILNNNLSKLYSKCEIILKKHKEGVKITEKEYIWFIFSADTYYRTKDITFLNKKLKETKNNFDSSLYVLSRSVLENYIYFKYLLSEDNKIRDRFRAYICHSTNNNELKTLNSLKNLGIKGKFVFSDDPESYLSLNMMNEKIDDFRSDVKSINDSYTNEAKNKFENEIKILRSVECVAKEYDKIKNINSVSGGSENTSMEWIYNYVYRFQCMSAHQSLRDKEKVFNLFNNKIKPNNIHIIGLLNDIIEQILIFEY